MITKNEATEALKSTIDRESFRKELNIEIRKDIISNGLSGLGYDPSSADINEIEASFMQEFELESKKSLQEQAQKLHDQLKPEDHGYEIQIKHEKPTE